MKKLIGILSVILFLSIIFAGFGFWNYRNTIQNNILANDNNKEEVEANEESNNEEAVVEEKKEPRLYKLGDKGEEIIKLQQNLKKFGFNVNNDGEFGNETAWALRIFQKNNNLDIDGNAGEATLEKLEMEPTAETMYKPKEVAVTEVPANKEAEKAINAMNLSSPTKCLMWVDTRNKHTYVFSGENHKWSIIKDMICTVGANGSPTKKGIFAVDNKGLYFNVSNNVRCKYFTQFSGNYLFHSVPVDYNDNVLDSRLGMNLSQGCVRLSMENAKWVQDNMEYGTTVYVD